MGTKNKPGSFDCYANAKPDEPMFILLGRDPMAGALVRLWAAMRRAKGEDPAKLLEAEQCADALDRWSRDLGKEPVVSILAQPVSVAKVPLAGTGPEMIASIVVDVPTVKRAFFEVSNDGLNWRDLDPGMSPGDFPYSRPKRDGSGIPVARDAEVTEKIAGTPDAATEE